MIRIRLDQLSALLDAKRESFVASVAASLRTRRISSVLREPNAVERRVALGVRIATDCGFSTADGIAGFVGRMFEIHPGYHRHPSIRDWISDRSYDEEERLARVDTHEAELAEGGPLPPGWSTDPA